MVSVRTLRAGWGRLRTPVRASVIFTLTAVAARGIAFLSTAWFTRLLPPEAYGLYPLYTARLGLVSVFATWHLYGGTLYRRMQRAGPVGRDRAVTESLCLTAVPFCLTLAVYAVLAWVSPDSLGLSVPLSVVLFVEIAANTVLAFYYAKCRFLYGAWPYACATLSVAVLSPLVTAALLRYTSLGGQSRIVGPALVSVAAAIVAGVSLFRGVGRPQPLRQGGRLLREGLALLPYALALVSVEEVPRLLLGARVGAAALAKFGIACAVGTAPMLASSGISAVLQPWMLRKLAAGERETVRTVLRHVCIGAAALSVAVAHLSPELFSLLAPEGYRDAMPLVIPVTLSVLAHVLFLSMTAVSLFRERARQVTVGAVCAAALSIGACVLLIDAFGMAGAAWSVPVSYLFLGVLSYAVLRRGGDGDVLDIGGTCALFVLSATLCLLAVPLFPYPLPRFLLCAALAVYLVRYAFRVKAQLCEPT